MRQRAQVVRHLLHRQPAFHIARQGAEDFGVVCAAQQVEQGLVIVLGGGGQRGAPVLQLGFELRWLEAFAQHGVVGEFIDHARMKKQVPCRPTGIPQKPQQPLVHGWALQQQRQVAFAPKQRLDPVGQAHPRLFAHGTVADPGTRACQQAHQPLA